MQAEPEGGRRDGGSKDRGVGPVVQGAGDGDGEVEPAVVQAAGDGEGGPVRPDRSGRDGHFERWRVCRSAGAARSRKRREAHTQDSRGRREGRQSDEGGVGEGGVGEGGAG